MRITPRSGTPALEVVVCDGTGDLVVVFTGRRTIGGMGNGRGVLFEGVAHEERGRPVCSTPPTRCSRPSRPAHAVRPVRMARTSSSDSLVTSTMTSSPVRIRVSPRGRSPAPDARSPRPSRRGRPRSTISLSAAGEPSASVTSASRALPPSKESSRTNEPDRHRLLHQGGDQVRGRDGDVDAPHLVEHPLVLRVVDPGDDPRDAELLLGEQRDDEVVLVVAGDGATTSALSTCGLAHRVASQASAWSHGTPRGLTRPLGGARPPVVVDDQDLVLGLAELLADEPPDAPPPAMTTRISAPPWPDRRPGGVDVGQRVAGHGQVHHVAVLGHEIRLGTCATPSRPTAATRTRPGSSRSDSG